MGVGYRPTLGMRTLRLGRRADWKFAPDRLG